MKHCLALCSVLLLALSLPAFGGSVDFSNSGGTLTGSNAGLSLSGSVLFSVTVGSTVITGNNLGSVTFSTGALSGGSLAMGGTFDAGGSFVITTNGTGGLPNGTIFSGTFDQPSSWTLVTLANGTHNYTLTGTLSGTTITGATVSGVTVQLTINTGKGFFNGSTTISSGDTNFTASGSTFGIVPEPSSLLYLGTGLVALAGLVKRKLG